MRASTLPTLLIAAGLLLAGRDIAAGDAERGAALLEDFGEGVQTLSARFEQSLVDAEGVVVEESAGTLEIARPGRFRWTYREPYEQLLVADGLNVWSYDPDLQQVTVKPQDELLGSTPALLLGGGADVLQDFEIIEQVDDRGTSWVRLRPLGSDSGFDSVELGFTGGTLSRMIFVDSLGQSTLIALFEVEVNEPIAADRFAFSPPDDADLVGAPLPPRQADM